MAVTLKGYTANYLGLSTDVKPTEADDNAIFRELDTGKRYYFTGAAWAEIPSSGGGGGGDVTSVNGKTGAVTLTASDVGAYTDDETDALLANKQGKTLSASVKIGTETETTVEGAIGEVAAIIPATAAVSNKLSTAADTAKEDITGIANSEDIALTDSTDARVHDLRIYGKTVDGHSVGENGLTVTATGKNLLNTTATTTTKDGVTFTVDSTNGTITINGQNETSSGLYFILAYRPSFPTGQLILSGCPSGGGNDTYSLVYTNNVNVWRYDYGGGANIEAIDYEQYYNSYIAVRIGAGYSVNNVVMRPMVRRANVSADFEPYKANTLPLTTALPLRRKMLTVDLGDFDWEYTHARTYESGTLFNRFATLTTAEGMFDPTKFTDTGNVKEDGYLLTQESCSGTYTVSGAPGGHEPITDKTIIMSRKGRIYVIDNSYTDPAEFKAAVTGITLTYPSYCDEIDLADGIAITRLDSNGDVLATPVTTPLSDAEKAAFAEFRTFDGNTNVTATDDPFMTLNYVKNTDNGKAFANVDDRVDNKVDKNGTDRLMTAAEGTKLAGIETGATKNTVIDTTCTLTVAGWTGNDAPYTQTVNVTGLLSTDKPILDLSVSPTVATGVDEIDDWALISKAESGAGTLTFSCYEDKPTMELTVNVKVVR